MRAIAMAFELAALLNYYTSAPASNGGSFRSHIPTVGGTRSVLATLRAWMPTSHSCGRRSELVLVDGQIASTLQQIDTLAAELPAGTNYRHHA